MGPWPKASTSHNNDRMKTPAAYGRVACNPPCTRWPPAIPAATCQPGSCDSLTAGELMLRLAGFKAIPAGGVDELQSAADRARCSRGPADHCDAATTCRGRRCAADVTGCARVPFANASAAHRTVCAQFRVRQPYPPATRHRQRPMTRRRDRNTGGHQPEG